MLALIFAQHNIDYWYIHRIALLLPEAVHQLILNKTGSLMVVWRWMGSPSLPSGETGSLVMSWT